MEKEKLIALVKGVQKGDESAMTQMYEAFYEDIYYYIFKTINDSELAADLTQDTFIEILQSIGSLQEPVAFVTWSRQIAYRRCTAYFKKRHDLLVDEDEDGYSVFDTIAEEREEFIPGEALDKEDLKQTIHGIINELPEEQRAAIMMRYFDEISVADIAKIQGVSEGTVKSRLNYGRKAIKQSVEEYEKKHDVKLHSVGIVPLLLWLLREYRRANGLSLTTGAASTTGAAAAVAAATPATAAVVTGTTAAVAAKTAGTALAAKIVAGVLAASVAVGGTVWGITKHNQDTKQPEKDPAETTSQSSLHLPEDESEPETNPQPTDDYSWSCDQCGSSQSPMFESETLAGGIQKITMSCPNCAWSTTYGMPTSTDQPIYVNSIGEELIAQFVTEKSHHNMQQLLMDTWDLTEDPTVTVTCIGTLYFYNDEWIEDSADNNRLIFVYHIENGIVPGGWYTYLGPNGNVVLKYTGYVQDADEENNLTLELWSTVSEGEFLYRDYMSYLWLECMKEYYSFIIDTDYPVSFVYNGIRYMGHTTVEDCLIALEENSFKEWELEFDHMVASGQMQDYVTNY